VTETDRPVFAQLNLITSDMAAAVAFYTLLGLEPTVTPDGVHAEATLHEGVSIEWDSRESVGNWDSRPPASTGSSNVIGFALPSREAVDALYAELTAAGYRGHQVPHDAFFGARLAIVDDPDGNPVGLMSPMSAEFRYWPPRPAPSS
jgi:catechol 2,3-dioxygenase-like lactoylglutathione lyase family enzyme